MISLGLMLNLTETKQGFAVSFNSFLFLRLLVNRQSMCIPSLMFASPAFLSLSISLCPSLLSLSSLSPPPSPSLFVSLPVSPSSYSLLEYYYLFSSLSFLSFSFYLSFSLTVFLFYSVPASVYIILSLSLLPLLPPSASASLSVLQNRSEFSQLKNKY